MLIDLNEIDYEIDYGDDLQIEFVSYTGRYPKLCRGDLTLLINGKKRVFHNALFSLARVYLHEGWQHWIATKAPWRVLLPSDLSEYGEIIEECVNEHVPWGCCGGCAPGKTEHETLIN